MSSIIARIESAMAESYIENEAEAAIEAFLQIIAEQGWSILPNEPTEEMKLQGARDIGKTMRFENHIDRSRSCYSAMLTAAPKFDWNDF